jgi:hypothetical protein
MFAEWFFFPKAISYITLSYYFILIADYIVFSCSTRERERERERERKKERERVLLSHVPEEDFGKYSESDLIVIISTCCHVVSDYAYRWWFLFFPSKNLKAP